MVFANKSKLQVMKNEGFKRFLDPQVKGKKEEKNIIKMVKRG
jgi:hypothetical protein